VDILVTHVSPEVNETLLFLQVLIHVFFVLGVSWTYGIHQSQVREQLNP